MEPVGIDTLFTYIQCNDADQLDDALKDDTVPTVNNGACYMSPAN